MEILWWWAPAVVVTLVAIAWVSWYGRDGRGDVDRDEAVQRLGEALARRGVETRAVPARLRDRSTGIAVRPTRSSPPVPPGAVVPRGSDPDRSPGPEAS